MAMALEDVTVLDLTQFIPGPYATKLLADYGADVIKIERPDGGDRARHLGPFKDDEPGPERSGLFYYLNTNKRSLILNLKSASGRQAFFRLLEKADIVVESFKPGVMDRLGVGWGEIQRARPDVPLVSISNFGPTGPYRDYKATELVMYGFAGEMYSMGMNNREPVKMAGTAALFESGSAAAVGAIGALFGARFHGRAQHVDISIAETHLGGVDRRHATEIAYSFSGRRTVRNAGTGGGYPAGIYPCADGYVDFSVASLRWDRLADMLGNPEWVLEERWRVPGAQQNLEMMEEFLGHFYEWLLARTKRQVWAEARRAKVLCGPLFTMRDLFEDEHFRGRGFWEQVEHQVMGKFEIPGRPFLMSETPWQVRRPAPLLGEHTSEVLREAGYTDEDIVVLAQTGAI